MGRVSKYHAYFALALLCGGASIVASSGTLAGAGAGPAVEPAAPDAADLEGRLLEAYQRISPAVVHVEGLDGGSSRGGVAVIVTAEGHILMSDGLAGRRIAVTLPDGRIAKGQALGWSREWGVGLGKLDEGGPWPHCPIVEVAHVRAGQPLATLVYPLEDEVGWKPLLDLEWANRSAPGYWFTRPNGTRYEWQMRGGLAFDLDGRLLGIENATSLYHGSVYTHVDRVRAMWPDLVNGKNIDQARLADGLDDNHPPAPRPEAIPAEAEEKAIAASVGIRYKPDDPRRGVSGTIITADGLVATCAHHYAMPGTPVVVELSDGRDLAGEIVGLSFPTDISLVRITESGPFPHAEIGVSNRLQPGDPCLFVGYGPVDAEARRPDARSTFVVSPKDGHWSFLLPIDPSLRLVGGDSGGGLFDAEGKLVAFSPAALGYPDWPKEFARVELLLAQHDALRVSGEQSDVSDLAPVEQVLEAAAVRARPWIVEVMDGDRVVALGTVVDADGLILTNWNALPETATCRLSNGRVLPATVSKVAREHNLSVLQVEAVALPVVRWSDAEAPPVGALVTIAGPKPTRGTVAHAAVAFRGDRGRLGVTVNDTDRGPEVAALTTEHYLPSDPVYGFGPQPLEMGDVIRDLEGRPTATLAEIVALLDPSGAPVAFAGDRVRLTVERNEGALELSFLLRPPDIFPLVGQTARRSGFARAYGVMASPDRFGGAVVDREGRAVGVAIAARQKGWVLVLPASVVRSVIE